MSKNQLTTVNNNDAVGFVFQSIQSFEAGQRMAKILAASNMVPDTYKGNIGDCTIALDIAQRMKANPLMIMQNLNVIYGRPSWSSQFIIASVNSCGRFEPLRFEVTVDNDGKAYDFEYQIFESEWVDRKKITKVVKKRANIVNKRCVAWTLEKGTVIPQIVYDYIQKALEKNTDISLYQACKKFGVSIFESSPVSVEMAHSDGWVDKPGSKWKTMPDQMLNYRAASFFGRLYTPEILMGMPTTEEVIDTDNMTDVTPKVVSTTTATAEDLNKEFLSDDETGEVIAPEPQTEQEIAEDGHAIGKQKIADAEECLKNLKEGNYETDNVKQHIDAMRELHGQGELAVELHQELLKRENK